ncbi:MAG: amidase [Chloroflexi bacterium]|nr:MAG: amidase [Chloroflexota bacterium]
MKLSRRDVLKMGVLAGAGASIAAVGGTAVASAASARSDLNEKTIVQLQGLMSQGKLSAVDLVEFYFDRISHLDQAGPRVNSIIELNPDARSIAQALDRERRATGPRGPLHGIPVLLKDNVDTHDRMQTASGSLALAGIPAPSMDATVAAKLRQAGAIVLGKAGLSEWANFRGSASTSGWSGRGGLCNNPYIIDTNPSGSSSGSAAAVAANFTAVAIGTETDGSIVGPANNCGVVGIKPTVGLVSRAGVIPISHTQDTVGPHARTVADAAAVLSAIVSRSGDIRDPATNGVPLGWRGTGRTRPRIPADYTAFLDPNGLSGARIGVARQYTGPNLKMSGLFDQSLAAMAGAGATLVDVNFNHFDAIFSFAAEIVVLFFDFHQDLNAYLATRPGTSIHTIDDVIAFNSLHADQELKFFGQELMVAARDTDIHDAATIAAYQDALNTDKFIGASDGIDALLAANSLDAIVAPTDSPAWTTDLVNGDHFTSSGSTSPAAIVGYPIINVPSGMSYDLLPVGVSFFSTAFSEPTLIKLASGFEHVTQARRQPTFLSTFPANPPSDNHERKEKSPRRPVNARPNMI